MKQFKFEETVTYLVTADDVEEAEAKMGEENSSDYEVNRELDYKGEVNL